MLTIILSILIGPVLAILLYSYMRYRFSGGYFGLLIRSYFWGVFSTFIAAGIFFFAYTQDYIELKNLRRILFYSFIIIGVGQELGKFLVLRYLMLPSKLFRNPSDGIIYSLMITFGAITIINAVTYLVYPQIDPTILISYGFVSMVFAVIMGFFVGMGKVRNNRLIDSLTGLFGAAFFHGSYEFIIQTSDHLLLWPFLIGSSIITFLLIVKGVQVSDEI
ncbi:MAG: PrsW family intramembrane metalloprotease [Bacteroidales bacterium]|nr:PrsW family intramembrane metalloprotease [Bacteroidales bacterium]